jgi:hypothetical protein
VRHQNAKNFSFQNHSLLKIFNLQKEHSKVKNENGRFGTHALFISSLLNNNVCSRKILWIFTICNRIWNCSNGRDEINCGIEYNDYIRKALHCKSNEQYCIQLINNNNDLNATCININQTGDGIIDCIGGTDERLTNICLEKYPTEFQQRFLCMNSSFCIRLDQVCDTISNCPFHDDELICPWLFKSNSSTFYCENSPLDPVVRCDKYEYIAHNPYCQMREHLWFCDLELEGQITTMSFSIPFELYPPIDQNIKSISFESSNPNQLSNKIFIKFM